MSYKEAKEKFSRIGVDTEKAIERAKNAANIKMVRDCFP